MTNDIGDTGRAPVVAASRDGRTFTFEGDPPPPLLVGDVVVLTAADGHSSLGQVLEHSAAAHATTGSGSLIGDLSADGELGRASRRPFASATVEPASARDLEALQRARQAALPIGTWTSGGVEVPARLRAQGFARHTFLCGQSGSGKTYALGVILEQLLLGTDLRMIVLDPNADFVRLGTAGPHAPTDAADRIAQSDIQVLSVDPSIGATPLRIRFATMPTAAQAAILQLDPLADRGEYNHFLRMVTDDGPRDVHEVVARLAQGGPDGRALAQRIENLGLPTWGVWAGERTSAAEVVGSGARCTVLDLSGFRTAQEAVAVSLELIEALWAQRTSRTPTLIVLDEAHNICPAGPTGHAQAAVVERLVQIAAEGRKYGLWLLVSTQRPAKIHPQILSQCDNLVLMRMNSPADIAELTDVFGFAPPAMLRSSSFFGQGEALVAGGFVPVPSIIEMGARLTIEGGRDVAVPVT
jgi:hypothetical protein